MLAQHILTQPVFEALFEGYEFAKSNPVARSLDGLRKDFGEFGLENEIRHLEDFYESVRLRTRGLDNSAARQRVLMELYEKFFTTALKKEADRLGIVYTPVEVVDFILHSADYVLQQEFGRSLSDAGVHVLDPFTGTGIFLVRMLQSNLIRDEDLMRKYQVELHANEIVLLAYYIATVHIEEAYHGRLDSVSNYEPFQGIVLTDTFNLKADSDGFPSDWLPGNSERAERQQKLPIQVIVGNPPWSAGQRSSADNNPNIDYPELERRVAETYAARSKSTNKNSLYDTYKMAIRWASDRIGEQGVVAFVTNGSWIDGNVDSGVRACLAEDFSSVHVLNLRGNARTSGERARQEGGQVFPCRVPVAITILTKNPAAMHKGCRILYRDIGNYLKREEKLRMLRERGSIIGIEDWEEIIPDKHDDWIGQRDEAFESLYLLGSKATKVGKSNEAVFRLFSNGYKTGRDAYLYNFSRDNCAENARLMVDDYLAAKRLRLECPDYSVDEAMQRFSKHTRWDQSLKDKLRRQVTVEYSDNYISVSQYRPFVKQYLYGDFRFGQRKYQQDRIFPPYKPEITNESRGGGDKPRDLRAGRGREEGILGSHGRRDAGLGGGFQVPVFSTVPVRTENCAICVPGIGATKPFSVLIADRIPDLHFVEFGQCLPRYTYPNIHVGGGNEDPSLLEAELERVDNITDAALDAFQEHYSDEEITKDTIFAYVYGVLHAPAYRERFANDLAKALPRIPMALDFDSFAKAGRTLAELHLGYESCTEYPLEVTTDQPGGLRPHHYRFGGKSMRFATDDRTVLIVNDYIRLKGIPETAHEYVVNGRTPLEWFIDRYRVTTDQRSEIVNDPNGWFEEPEDLIAAIRRIVHVSVETTRIVAGLPEPFPRGGL